MKRDMDFVRDLLLEIEGGKSHYVTMSKSIARSFWEDEANYPDDQEAERLEYHLRLLESAGYIRAKTLTAGGDWVIQQIEWKGHDFLDSVRDPEIWKKTKAVATKAKGFSIDLLGDIAKGLIKTQIKKHTDIEIDL